MEGKQLTLSQVAIDAVIISILNNQINVLLEQRNSEPFAHQMELPGGLLRKDETAEMALKRKVEDILNHPKIYFQQFHTFTDPDRDPRSRTVSIGFLALVKPNYVADIPSSFNWHLVDQLPELAFDHKKIIQTALEFLRQNLNTHLVQQLMPELFPLNQLQKVYEIIENKTYDNRNFRKKMISSEIVEKTSQKETAVTHRPANLFRFTPE